ncbi:hypothetical protein SK128_008379 [Halocaridina rubra]|uniref:SRA1/Sec31 domain-containing protein n=1 Tax=Halocaridina rubra TaxID=373956 RepID=A0AAN8WMH4_HALRR
MNPLGPGNHDRAWNDPPKFAFNSGGGTGGPANTSGRRRLLNKRVPVPTGPQAGASPTPVPLKPGDGPPVSSPPLAPSVTRSPCTGPPSDSQLTDKICSSPIQSDIPHSAKLESSEETLKDVELSFRASFQRVSDHLKDNVRDGILKKFEVMKSMWLENKLNDAIQSRMLILTKALEEGDYDRAWSLHQGLIVDFTSMCSPWMIGIKTLVTECRNLNKSDSNDLKVAEGNDEKNPSQVLMLSPDMNELVTAISADSPDLEMDEQEEK